MSLIPLVLRATFNATGGITFTGNTLGLSRSAIQGVPGDLDSIGAFITTNTSSVFGTYPLGTTNNYVNNSSSANLVMPSGSMVLYAELIWGGSYINGSVNLSAAINNPVTFITPLGTNSVTPDPTTYNAFDLGNGAQAYVRSANVTPLVQQAGSGTYTTGSVVGTIVITGDNTANHAGWTLAVIYSNASLPFRNMTLRAGGILVSASNSTTITGFATPTSGPLGGRALFSAQEGDANRTGDSAQFGPTSATLVSLSGPNNFANNFFASQINNDAGLINTTGTFGSSNQTNGAPGTNIVGGRQGWDITNVDISARLINNQSSAVLNLTTSGDVYIINANAIQININSPTISVVKSASATGLVLGDTYTYTVVISNTGTANAASVVLTDVLPSGATFIPGSVVVAGTSRPTYDILSGVPIGTLNFGSSVTITYRATVSSIPPNQTITNSANAAFTFQSVAGGSTITGVIPSNNLSIPVYDPLFTIVKSADTSNATVGDTVTYTAAIVNTGNIGATVNYRDTIPAGTTYVPGSFRVNGTQISGANPATGVNIGTLALGSTTNVTFQVVVNSLPSPPTLVNQGNISYTFQPPDGRSISGSAASNTLSIPVTTPNVGIIKTANVTDTSVGQTITYTTVVTNNGLTTLQNIVFTDASPTGTNFVVGSFTIDGVVRPNVNPANSISIGSLQSGRSTAISFQALVTSVPSTSQITNQSSISYSSGSFTGNIVSNTVSIPVYVPNISALKSFNAASATIGDQLEVTLQLTNTGNIGAQVQITDNIPAGTSFVTGSVILNGTNIPGANPANGFSIGTLGVNTTSTVTFKLQVTSLQAPQIITNTATINYTYTLPSGRAQNGSLSSNTVSIPVSAPNISLVKIANTTEAALNDVITYSITVRNNGSGTVSSIILSDITPEGTSFVTGSVRINNVSVSTAVPSSGITIGPLASQTAAVVTYQLKVNSLPASGAIANRATAAFTSGSFTGSSTSNTVTIPVYNAAISLVKSTNTTLATTGDTLTYTILISNSGNTATSLTLTDQLPSEVSFVTNSVVIGGIPAPGKNPVSGFLVADVPAGGVTVVTFLVTINSLPPSQKIRNQATALYYYQTPTGRVLTGDASSNSVIIQVSAPNVTVVTSASTALAVVGDRVTYTTTITNGGSSSITNVILSDGLPQNVSFVPGSVVIGGVSAPNKSPLTGIPIGSLAPGASAVVTFEVNVTMAVPSQINNQSTVSFTSGVFSGTSTSNQTQIPVTQPQISLTKTASTNNATVGDTVVYTITATNSGNLAAALVVSDTIPAGTTFTPNSVLVNGISIPGVSIIDGINTGVIAAGANSVLSFSVTITSLPSPQLITNQASSTFTFTTPDNRTLTGTAQSNTVSFPVSSPNVLVTKSSSLADASVGDTLTYTVTVTNLGIEAVQNVLLSDPVTGTTFIPGSVTINGAPSVAANPSEGITLGGIAPSASATVTYNIRVSSVPSPPEISSSASVSFTSGVFAGTTFSNAPIIPVYNPVLSAAKSASKINATVGDTLTYSITVSNTGNFSATMNLTDTIPAGTTFVPNSVLINGLPSPGSDPSVGIVSGNITPGTTSTITFSVVIDTLPNPQFLSNQSFVSYTYTLPSGRTLGGNVSSNVSVVTVSAPNVTAVKLTSLTALTVGDVNTYTVTIGNNGIETVNNVIVTDALPAATSFVNGSVYVDGTQRPTANPSTGVTIGSITPGSTVNVTFQYRINSIPTNTLSQITNRAIVTFTSGSFSGSTFSNTVNTPVYSPILSAVKTANTINATVGDTVVYTITYTNTGNYGGNVVLTDLIPEGTTLIPNSVILNGAPVPGANPATGMSVGVVSSTAIVMFSVVINSLPVSQQLSNQAASTFTYTLPDGRTLNGSFVSNLLQIPVSSPNVTLVKSASVSTSVVGDTYTYRVNVTNNGIANVNNAVLSDVLTAETSFIPGSVTVGGSSRLDANPAGGINIGTIAPGSTVTVTFDVKVNTLPRSPYTVQNRSSISFTSGAFTGASYSNTVSTSIYQPIFQLVKTASTSNATVGDTVTYFLNLTNTGNLPGLVTLTDDLPEGAVLVPNSVLINGVPQPGVNPETGIPLGNVAPGANINITVTLQIVIDTLPDLQQLINQATGTYTYIPPDGRLLSGSFNSNALVIPVSSPNVTVVKTTSTGDAVVGDTITYTVVITNNGIVEVENAVMVDPVPVGTTFVSGSVIVDGNPRPNANPNTGVTVGTIQEGASSTITFQVQVVTI